MAEHPFKDNSTDLLGRIEWDYEDIDKSAWGPGEWLNEPDKVQCVKEGYPCLVVRSHHGAFCGYIGISPSHPAYGLSTEGVSNMLIEIRQADFRDRLAKWGRSGMPLKDRLPDIEPGLGDWPEPTTDVGRAVAEITVHGGLTWAGVGADYSHARWVDLVKEFDKARKVAKRYPIGDAARWLQKWAKAEHSYEEFKRIAEQTCICYVSPPGASQTDQWEGLWFFGFDCAHAFDLCPAIEHIIRSIRLRDKLDKDFPIQREMRDVYRNLAYVEDQCLQLAIQLRAIEDHAHGNIR